MTTCLVWLGLGLTLLAGVGSGNCMLPMKFARRWKWENLWLVFSLVSLLVLPWSLALVLVKNLGSVYSSITPNQLLLPFLLGAGWGVAQVLFGLSIARLGLALGYAIIIGLGSVGGTLVPLIMDNRPVFATARGALILTGIAVMLAGIAVSARAGRQREHNKAREHGRGYAIAAALAILCGLLAPMVNYSFAFGQVIAEHAIAMGIKPVNAAYAVWPVTLAGGLFPNLAYSVYLLTKNRTWILFRGPVLPDVEMATLMGVLWMGAMALYGMASVYLGTLGTSVGWGLFQIFMIITANLSGLLAGEWATAPANSRRTLYAGLALLTISTVLLASANR
jgi:L-rhamnose-H+ transport protein